jgi:glycosyltransferase involved in cell wall biosynthesis
MTKLFRVSTVPMSLDILLKGQLRFLNKTFNVTAISGEGIELRRVETREGVKVIAIEMKREISPWTDARSLINLYLSFRREKPLIVHSITPKAGLLSMIAAKLAGVPIRMHTYTGLIFPSKNGITKKLLILMDKLLCACATNIYPEGNGVKLDLEFNNITRKPLKVLANGNINGVDISYFDNTKIGKDERISLRSNLKIRESDFVFIFVGRLVGDKGINELINAFIRLDSANAKLLLVGGQEPLLDPLSEKTKYEINNNDNIISVGYQSDVRLFFSVSDLLVFPSYREGFPNVVLQAGAMGLPAIVTNINGCNEIIINNKNGIIIPAKDSEALQNAMAMFLKDRHFLSKLKFESRKVVVDRFEQSFVWKALLDEYQYLMLNLSSSSE